MHVCIYVTLFHLRSKELEVTFAMQTSTQGGIYMYTGVHSDESQESGCTSKEQATFIKASQALMWVITFIAVQAEINCGNKSMLM